jgi:ribosome-associated heat shock protein Hsp15
MKLRIDKFVWFVRMTKTRIEATELVKSGKIFLNHQIVKASKEVIIGDSIQIKKNNATFNYIIIELLDRRIGPKLVDNYILDQTEPQEKEKYQNYQLTQKQYRINGTGKPTKKQRRLIISLKDVT